MALGCRHMPAIGHARTPSRRAPRPGSAQRESTARTRADVPLPETIPVRYTEEEAGYVTVRPVVRQTFRLDELLDMILSVAGKDLARIRQLLHSGTVVYHFYRYSWAGFDVSDAELAAVLARFPDAEPSRPFVAEACKRVVFESGGANPQHLLELDRAAGSKRRFLRARSFWDCLLEIAEREKPAYQSYSYVEHADVYRMPLDERLTLEIGRAAEQTAPRNLRAALRAGSRAVRAVLFCPRPSAKEGPPARLSSN